MLKHQKAVDHGNGQVGLWASISTCRMPGTSSWISFSSLSTSLPRAVTTSSPARTTQVSYFDGVGRVQCKCQLLVYKCAYRSLTSSAAVHSRPSPLQLLETKHHQCCWLNTHPTQLFLMILCRPNLLKQAIKMASLFI